jgi:hypothetical protein
VVKRRERLSAKKGNLFQLKLDGDVLERYMALLRKVEKRNDQISEAEVNKRLLGLVPPDKWVTEADIKAFREQRATGRARVGKPEGGVAAAKKKQVNGDD